MNVRISQCVIPMFQQTLKDVLSHKYTKWTFPGGRGSTKSSFAGGICIPLIIVKYPNVNAVCFRKVGNTIQNSIYSQVVWGIYKLKLDKFFHIPKTYSNPIVFKPTGQKIFFMGLDDPNKVKSIKVDKGYIGVTWFNNSDQVKPLELMETPNVKPRAIVSKAFDKSFYIV